MPGRTLQRDEEHLPATRRASPQVQGLVRALIGHALESPASTPFRTPDGNTQEVVLDVEVDGVRCLLVRISSSTTRGQPLLSPREQEIARMVAKGYANKTIAAVLEISPWTVSTYLRRVFAKLGVGTRAAMVARLLEENGVEDPLLHSAPPPERRTGETTPRERPRTPV